MTSHPQPPPAAAPASPGSDPRTPALVRALLDAGLVDPARRDEAATVVDHVLSGETARQHGVRRQLAELGGYLGAGFVLAGVALFVGDRWDDLGLALKVGLLVACAVVLAVAGAVVVSGAGGRTGLRHPALDVRRRLASVLLTAAAGAAAGAAMVWVAETLESPDGWVREPHLVGLAGSLTFVVLAWVGYLLAPSVVGHLAIAYGAVVASVDVLDWAIEDWGATAVAHGAALLGLGLVWLVSAETARWREVMVGRAAGCVMLLVGAQMTMEREMWIAYTLTAVVGLAAFGWYVARQAWPYLALGVVALTIAVPEALLDWTEGTLGAAGVLLAVGVTLVVASAAGLGLRRAAREDGGN